MQAFFHETKSLPRRRPFEEMSKDELLAVINKFKNNVQQINSEKKIAEDLFTSVMVEKRHLEMQLQSIIEEDIYQQLENEKIKSCQLQADKDLLRKKIIEVIGMSKELQLKNEEYESIFNRTAEISPISSIQELKSTKLLTSSPSSSQSNLNISKHSKSSENLLVSVTQERDVLNKDNANLREIVEDLKILSQSNTVSLTKEVYDTKAKLSNLETSHTDNIEQINSLKTLLLSTTQERDALIVDNANLWSIIEDLKKFSSEAAKKLSSPKNQISTQTSKDQVELELEVKISTLQEEKKILQQRISQYEININDLHKDINVLNTNMKQSLQLEIESNNKKNKIFEDKISNLRQENESQRLINEKLAEYNEKALLSLAQVADELQVENEDKKRILEELDIKYEEVDILQKECIKLNHSVSVLEVLLQSSQRETEDIVTNLNNTLHEIKNQLNDERNENIRISILNESNSNLVLQLREELTEGSINMTFLHEQNSNLELEVHHLRDELLSTSMRSESVDLCNSTSGEIHLEDTTMEVEDSKDILRDSFLRAITIINEVNSDGFTSRLGELTGLVTSLHEDILSVDTVELQHAEDIYETAYNDLCSELSHINGISITTDSNGHNGNNNDSIDIISSSNSNENDKMKQNDKYNNSVINIALEKMSENYKNISNAHKSLKNQLESACKSILNLKEHIKDLEENIELKRNEWNFSLQSLLQIDDELRIQLDKVQSEAKIEILEKKKLLEEKEGRLIRRLTQLRHDYNASITVIENLQIENESLKNELKESSEKNIILINEKEKFLSILENINFKLNQINNQNDHLQNIIKHGESKLTRLQTDLLSESKMTNNTFENRIQEILIVFREYLD